MLSPVSAERVQIAQQGFFEAFRHEALKLEKYRALKSVIM